MAGDAPACGVCGAQDDTYMSVGGACQKPGADGLVGERYITGLVPCSWPVECCVNSCANSCESCTVCAAVLPLDVLLRCLLLLLPGGLLSLLLVGGVLPELLCQLL